MHTTGLARPPRPSRSHRPATERATARAAARARERGHAEFGRVLRWSLVASVLLHGLVLLLSPGFLRVGPPPGDTDTLSRLARPSREIQLINPVVSENAPETAEPTPAPLDRAAPPPREPARFERAVVPVPSPSPGAADGAPVVEAEGARESARDALRPGYRDPRLWVNPRQLRVEEQLSDHERYKAHLQARIDALNDSIYRVAERERKAKDWTFKDKEGRRWGLSPEGLHLGGVTVPPELIPKPATTGDNQSIEAEREERRQRDEIRRQEEDRERRKTQEERARATRERKEAERKKGGGG